MSLAEFDADVVVDARNCIMGRVASEVAQRSLAGEKVAVINAEDAVITGSEDDVMGVYRKRAEIGSDQGPYYPKRPDRIFKRAIRGMVPYKKPRGREAFSNIRVYVGNPFDEDGEMLDDTSLDRLSNIKFISLGEVSEKLGANVTW
ncbi:MULTISPECIES: 50S ribosomal protein L13 [Haloferax]|uniref:Large ribosomal subunit protein uL13 n=2 Tax=Haloferax TaxID=2251 RepID=A0A1H7RQU7_HALLR|nr:MULTISPECIES: 50S ribosomal protein L13 [Haloferax]ELZ78605.1 50S ribosomal protein L13P [Haloferax larsenii JCM 13917]ELZ83069.1 50S ribosomal protein L13P [Haloferax elongans ATCC BAA-1513]UVE50125.1 50S ribosomal protein L13 [Haloferax larsenii]SEL62581.1 LSU ribosomal protein L13P [Haloferax larsenii]